jgi:GrpB-like predicted nucleotidyltransferase (UPF0157 family)
MTEIEIVAYDPDWPAAYDAERAELLLAFVGLEIVEIAHIGSTAVPGLAAAPVIDIAASLRSLDEARGQAMAALEALGYAFWADASDPEHLFFAKPPPRRHHLHLVEPGAWFDDTVRFRDILRRDATAARSYEALKRDLIADRDAYSEAKSTFVAVILSR